MSDSSAKNASVGGWAQAEEIALVRRASTSLYARLRSIERDARRALQLRTEVAADLPLYGNVRAGAWYVPSSAKRCFFKSADGHYSQWGVSTRRPNIPFLKDAVLSGGAVVVDVTRAGKVWPDALSKTLPMWCAVVSALALGLDPDDARLPNMLYLHPSVPKSEAAAIERLLATILRTWKDSGMNLRELVPALAPLVEKAKNDSAVPLVRCVWARSDSNSLWENGLPGAAQLGYVPILCVSASPPMPADSRAFVEADDFDVEGQNDLLVSGVAFPPRTTGFAYVQGAGDDEEGWSLGLTPLSFWSHRTAILAYCEKQQNVKNEDPVFREGLERLLSELERGSSFSGMSFSDALSDGCEEPVPLEVASVLRTARLRVIPSTPSSLLKDVYAVGEQSPVLVLSHSLIIQGEIPTTGCVSSASTKKISWMYMADARGKPDYKHSLRKNLNKCLHFLREVLADPHSDCATVLCDSGDGDWATAVAVAWIASYCSPELDSLRDNLACQASNLCSVGKQRLKQIALRIAAERADLVLSRRTSQQLNSFFMSSD